VSDQHAASPLPCLDRRPRIVAGPDHDDAFRLAAAFALRYRTAADRVLLSADILSAESAADDSHAFEAESAERHRTRRNTMTTEFSIDAGSRLFERLLDDRIVFLGSEVSDEIANEICAKLLLLAAVDPRRDIHLYINSPGGSVTAGFAIYDCMRFVTPDIVTVGVGLAASMGQFLLTSGTPGKRFVLPNTRVVMHQPLGGFGGTAADIGRQAEQIVAFKQEMAHITAEQTGHALEEIIADGDRDAWFTATEAVGYGFADAVLESSGTLPVR
jgi:ATP-dependent Clp protease protease subunit